MPASQDLFRQHSLCGHLLLLFVMATLAVPESAAAWVPLQVEPQKKVVIFFFDSGSEASDVSWLQYGVPMAVAVDLSQDPAIDLRSPTVFSERLATMGFPELIGVGRASARVLGREQGGDWIVLGSVAQTAATVDLSVRVFETRGTRLVSERTYSGSDVLGLADEVSRGIREDLGIASSGVESALDRPLTEILTGKAEAYKSFVEAVIAEVVNHDASEAEVFFRMAVELDPEFPMAHLAFGELLLREGRVEDAADYLTVAMDQQSRFPDKVQRRLVADYLWATGDRDRALEAIALWIQEYPTDVLAFEAQSRLLVETGRHDRALVSLQDLVDLDPSQGVEFLEAGDLWLARGDSAAGLRYLQGFADFYPGWRAYFTRKSNSARDSGDFDQAWLHLERSLSLAQDSPEVWADLGVLVAAMGDPSGSVHYFEEGLNRAETQEERQSALFRLGTQLIALGRTAKGMEYLERQLLEASEFSTDGELLTLRLSMVRRYAWAGRGEEALAFISEATEVSDAENEWGLKRAEAIVHLEMVNPDALESAISELEEMNRVEGFDPSSGGIHYMRAKVHEFRGEYREAISEFEFDSESDPAWPMYVGNCYRELGEYDTALTLIKESLDHYPNGPRSNLAAARTYEAMGRLEEARTHVSRAMRWFTEADDIYTYAVQTRELAARLGSG